MYVYSCTGATPHIFGIPTRTPHAAFCTVIVTTRSVPGHIHTSMTLPCSINREAVPQPLSPIQLLRVVHPLWRRITQNFLCTQNDPPIPCHSWIQPQASYLRLTFSPAHHLSSDPLVSLVIFLPTQFLKSITKRGFGACFPCPFIFTNPSRPSISPSLDRLSHNIPQVKDTFWTLT
jgi:hypothetical protein